ncbi:diguanylate cyclase [Sphingomonas sp. AOB5]|uniref:diguanylate cyclase n=1 Tax=Sphingomonas sp. AOB5 TaxID=3034017 RepID=UPI0023F7B0F1|nr:diguanylate cyclase [Sphingomonas sp. AOB5]MDF7776596.1 diguanylate cyclase [Sphingomonas sp. AOB5]
MVDIPLNDAAVWRGRKRRLAFGFGALLVLAGLFGAIIGNAHSAAEQRREAQSWYVHTLEVIVAAEGLKAAVNMMMRGERGYLITGDEKFLRSYSTGRKEVPELVARLSRNTGDNPVQVRNIASLRQHMTSYNRVLEQVIRLRRDGREAEAVAIVRSGSGYNQIEGLLAVVTAIESEERRLLAERARINEAAEQTIERHYYALAAVGGVLLIIAGAAGVSTARAQKRARLANERLRISATTDELTGLANRRSFMSSLEVEVARAKRSGSPLSVAVADVDFFKKINDSHGHAGGDEVLRVLARTAKETMRTGDVVGRLGGEEFAILMPDTDENEARIACERLRGAVAARKVRVPGGADAEVTLSTGIALLVPGEDRDRLVRRADDALYRAKEGGRNQVRLAA